jgi:hypothetical protein
MPIPDSQGTQFKFNGVAFLATNVKVMGSVSEIDASTLDLASGSMRAYQPSPLVDGDTVSCTYYGTQRPDQSAVHAIECDTLGISGNALCTKWENEAKVGELLAGSAEFRMSAAP